MRKYLIFSFYFLAVILSAYVALSSMSFGSTNRILIGSSKKIEGREIAFLGYWHDKNIVNEMIETGAIDRETVDNTKTIWIANMMVTSKQDTVKISVNDFELEDSNGEIYQPLIDPLNVKELKNGQKLEVQLVYYLPDKSTVSTITYTVKGDENKQLIFHVGD